MNNNDKDEIILSTLGHTWILDLDGTLLKHNGYKSDGTDTVLPGARDFISSIPDKDMIVIITSRTTEWETRTLKFLRENNIRYDHIIFNAPFGERILINDNKPGGLKCGYAVNCERDKWNGLTVIESGEM